MLPASASEMHKKYKKGEARQTVAAKAGAKLLTLLHRLSSLSTPCLAHTCNEDGLGTSLYRLVVPAGLTVCVHVRVRVRVNTAGGASSFKGKIMGKKRSPL